MRWPRHGAVNDPVIGDLADRLLAFRDRRGRAAGKL